MSWLRAHISPALLGALAAACSGGEGATTTRVGTPGYVPTEAVDEPATEARTPRRLRRLTSSEMEAVIAAFLGDERFRLAGLFLPDPRVDGYDNDALTLGVSESKLEEIGLLAERIAVQLAAPDNLSRHAPCIPGAAELDCARAFAGRAAPKVWGRPATALELDRLGAVFAVGRESEGYAGGIALLTEALVHSPHFVYRTELGAEADAPVDGSVTLAGDEIASTLSFLLQGGRPDPSLLEAGLRGKLHQPEGREQHARRLLANPAGRRRLGRFIRAWLGLDEVAMLNKDLASFPFFTPATRRAMDHELDRFLEHVFEAGEARLDELLLAGYTFPAPELMPIYGPDLLEPAGDFGLRKLDTRRRRGLLTSPAFLAAHGFVDHTNPVERGLLVRTRFFCQDILPPPPDVLVQQPPGPAGSTTRQRYEAHVAEPRCRVCHQMIDPLGFGFESFDAVGRYRTEENGQPVDARGEIVGTDVDGPFTGPVELAPRLLASAQFRRCFVQQLFRFAEGRSVESGDKREIDYLSSSFERSGHRIDELVVRLVRRPTFILRRTSEGGAP